MDGKKIHLSATQLARACTDGAYLAALVAGQNPGGHWAGGDGIAVHGAKIHQIVERFIDWAVAKENWQEAAQIEGMWGIFDKLQELGGFDLAEELSRKGQYDAAARLSENLERLATHLESVRTSRPGFRTWADVYLGQEYAINNVVVTEVDAGACVDISGIIDSLRLRVDGRLEIVDYKLSTGANPEYDLVQLAIYRRLLAVKEPALEPSGCIEYLWPTLTSMPASAEELQRIFRHYVEPTLAKLCATPQDVAQGAAAKQQVDGPGQVSSPSTPQIVAPTVATEPVTTGAPLLHPVRIGVSRADASKIVELNPADLTRHMAVLGGTGSGKTTAALNILEQLLERGLPVILMDRKGDMARYAMNESWAEAAADPALAPRAAKLRAALEVEVYTPGTRQGRALRLPLAPAGLQELNADDRELACRTAAATLADILGFKPNSPATAVLTCAFRILAARHPARGIEVHDLIELVGLEDPTLLEEIGPLDPKHGRQLVQALQTFKIMQGHTLDPAIETLSWQRLLRASSGKGRLTIINTKFLGNEDATLFWVAQFLTELLRYVSRFPSPTLQGVLMLDEADIYLPATSSPVTKAPIESLLKRARSAGFGIVLCTQSPGDLDYKCRDNIGTWLLGLVKEKRAQEKVEGALAGYGFDTQRLGKQKTGEFILAQPGHTAATLSDRNCIRTQQLSEEEILHAARASAG